MSWWLWVLLGFVALVLLWTIVSMVSPKWQDKLNRLAGMAENPSYLANQAAIESNLGRYRHAIELCDRAISVDPDCKEAWYNRGVAELELQSLGEAERSFREAVRIDAKFWQAWHNLASSLRKQGKDSEAETAMARAGQLKR